MFSNLPEVKVLAAAVLMSTNLPSTIELEVKLSPAVVPVPEVTPELTVKVPVPLGFKVKPILESEPWGVMVGALVGLEPVAVKPNCNPLTAEATEESLNKLTLFCS